MYFTVSAALLLVSSASFTKSLPTHDLLDDSEFANINQRGGITSTYCAFPLTYNLSMEPLIIYGNPVLITGMTVGPDPAGAEITTGYTYTTSKTFSGGISIGASGNSPDAIAEAVAKLSFSVSISTTKGTSVSANLYCPDNVICGLTAAAQYLHVEGTSTLHYCGWGGSSDPNTYPCEYPPNPLCGTISPYPNVEPNVPYPYTSDYPIKLNGNSKVSGQDDIVTEFNACAMGYPDGGLSQCPSDNVSAESPPGMTCNLQECTTATCQTMCSNLGVPDPSPTCQWSPALGCSWCNCQAYFSNLGGG